MCSCDKVLEGKLYLQEGEVICSKGHKKNSIENIIV